MLQIKEIPPRPADFDGALCLFGLGDVDDLAVRAALGGYGEITSCELNHSPPLVRFATHDAALAVRSRVADAVAGCNTEEDAVIAVSAALGLLCAGADTLYNERLYDDRGYAAATSSYSSRPPSPPLLAPPLLSSPLLSPSPSPGPSSPLLASSLIPPGFAPPSLSLCKLVLL